MCFFTSLWVDSVPLPIFLCQSSKADGAKTCHNPNTGDYPNVMGRHTVSEAGPWVTLSEDPGAGDILEVKTSKKGE